MKKAEVPLNRMLFQEDYNISDKTTKILKNKKGLFNDSVTEQLHMILVN